MNSCKNLLEKIKHHNCLNKNDISLVKYLLLKNLDIKIDPNSRGSFPNYDKEGTTHTTYICPKCGGPIHLDWLEPRNYCPQCGQKIQLPDQREKDMKVIIDNFKDEYAFLSNFFNAKLVYEGKTYLNSEAAFQAQKCPNRADEFINLNPSEAKKLGRHVELREDWEDVKDLIMTEVVEAKFTYNPNLKQMLLDTGDAELVEGNTWNDKYWGVCKGVGQNKLGKILMMLREEFKND